MKLIPNNVIFKKSHKKKTFKGSKGTDLAFHTTGLKVKANNYLSYFQFEAARRSIVRGLRPKKKKK